MSNLRRLSAFRVSRSPGSWLTLVLLFVVVVPSVGLFWFMNVAVDNERLAVRQKLIEAYRAQLDSVRDRLQSNWTNVANDLAARLADGSGPILFARALDDDIADAIICFDATGAVGYPDPPPLPQLSRQDPTWREAAKLEHTDPAAAAAAFAAIARTTTDPEARARALQAQARCLMQAGDGTAALEVLDGPLQTDELRGARDAQGRLIAPSADLMALDLAREVAPARVGAIRDRLAARLRDYTGSAMPSTQRLFLGRQLRRETPDSPDPAWLAAETLASSYLGSDEPKTREPTLQRTSLPEVWQTASADGRVVLLHRTEHLSARLLRILGPAGVPADLRMEFVAPGQEATNALLSVPAGDALPGWRMVVAPRDPEFFNTASSARAASYAWIVGLVVLTIIVFAALAWGLVRRQVALTQLRNDLVANVTHELKTPLASMRLLVDTLLASPRLEEQTTREYLQLIATENLRLSRLIGNFLTFSRIERNKYQFEFQDVPAADIVRQAAAAVQDRLTVPGCTFEVNTAPDLPAVAADADALVTALVNLLDNAWKYSGDDKVIAISARASNGHVRFAVRDNGLGLSPRDRQRIFGRFQQAHHHRSTGGGGVGLGLSIVQFIVSAHRGTIDVDSEPGRGSTFTIALPAAPEGSAAK